MKIYNSTGQEVPYKIFTFPDGQPHVELDAIPDRPRVTIEAAIRNPKELFDVLLVHNVLRRSYKSVSLDIRYLMGARMDRPTNERTPFTLDVVSEVLRQAGFYSIRVLDPHSIVAIRNLYASPVYPIKAIDKVLEHYDPDHTWLMAPDKGSQERVRKIVRHHATSFGILEGYKTRDLETGKLSGFGVHTDKKAIAGHSVLIVDDICDGGGTFAGMAAVLRSMGVTSVNLFVTHGIFSRGLPIEGIDHVWTTDSYYAPSYEALVKGLTVLPISMQESE